MTRSIIILISAVILGLALGVNAWMFSNVIRNPVGAIASASPQSNKSHSQKSPVTPINPPDTSHKTPETEEVQKQAPVTPALLKPSKSPDSPSSAQGTANKQSKTEGAKKPLEPVKSPDKPTEPNTPPLKPLTKAKTVDKAPTTPYPESIGNWKVRPFQTGCVATLAGNRKSTIVDPFEPVDLAMYIYHESDQSFNPGLPTWYGFVAPGRGEMSARLISPDGILIRGLTGSTGLSWDDLAAFGQKDMELRLTQCDLDGNCDTRVAILDLSAINSVAAATYRCANPEAK